MPDGQLDLDSRPAPPDTSMAGLVVLATVVGVDELGAVLDGHQPPGPIRGPRPTPSMVALGPDALGSLVALGFIGGDPSQPIILGRVPEPSPADGQSSDPGPVVIADGRRLHVDVSRELVLACGESSITLRANGRVVIRGNYIETRAKGVNRIRGGSVSIN